MTDLRAFLEGALVVEEEVSQDFEAARVLQANRGRTVLFRRIRGRTMPVVGNICPTRERLCSALGTTREGYLGHVAAALEGPVEPVITESEGPCQEVTLGSLDDLPILRHFEGDGGRYITSGIVVARDEELGRNASVHRLMVSGQRKLGIRMVERHLYEYYRRAEARNEPLEVAVAIGVHPAVLYAASYSAPIGYDEFRLAGGLLGRPLELVRCKTVGLEVPAQAEVVIEGRIPPARLEDEGPFVDVTGTYDIIRPQPCIEVTGITTRRNAVYQALLPSSPEHRLLMGMPRECGIYTSVSKVAKVKNVCLTEGSCSWLHGAVSIEKVTPEDGKRAIMAALEGHKSMKHVVIVDSDIDVFDPQALEFAVATRFQADKNAIILPNMKGSSLDPSAGKGALT
ncbi:MAG: UbiD family decarboxylase, partial [Euryarchaeota archaeon]|nr:UbiD family decarboxylase [Euryarchaeota archaeon]